MGFCCDIFFRTPCCCCEFYDYEKHLKSDLQIIYSQHDIKMLMFTITNFYNEIDINYPYYNNSDTLLQYACKNNLVNVVDKIIKLFGDMININIKTINGQTLLMISNLEISKLLIIKFPNIRHLF